ncbi:MAG: hypothetical protein NC200_07155 [Candidatus Gastranaerophilales bacterium]|nr:hypothetical protein [Candidatus Gastranaerophilales bacterium]
MAKKLNIAFVSHSAPADNIVSNALLAQLMVTITQIGIRVDKANDEYSKMEKEIKEVEEN